MQRIVVLLLTTMALALHACLPNTDPGDPDPTSTVRTSIAGRVVDEAGKSVSGATVRGHGATTTTDAHGVFLLKDVAVPSTRAVVMVSKGGYFTGARAAHPSASKTTTMLLTLQQATQTTAFMAGSGGTATLGSARIDLPAGTYRDVRGNAYTGTVQVAARYLDPAADTYYDSFSGDMAAVRADGSATELTSYGVLRVLLTGDQGQKLTMPTGAVATLTYPSAGASDPSIPLWHFDEQRAIWVEEGAATLNGGTYVGTVSHFTDWNLDVPNARRAFIEGRVTCGENIPLAGIVVDIGQVQAVTDQDGIYRRRVPADVAFAVGVRTERNDGIGAAATTVGPIAEQQTLQHDIVVSPCPTMLKAQMVDCDGKPVGGVLQVITPTGVRFGSSSTGAFALTVPSGTALTVEGYSMDGRTITATTVAPITAGATFDMGTVTACSGLATAYVDMTLPDGESARLVALNADGSLAAVVTQQNLHVLDVATGARQWTMAVSGTTAYPTGLQFVANGARVALLTTRGTTVVDVATGQAAGQVVAQGRQFITSTGNTVYVQRDSSALGEITEYDVASGAQQRVISIAGATQRSYLMGMQGDSYAVLQQFSPGAIVTVDLSSGAVVRTYGGASDSTAISEASTLSPSGKVVVVFGRGSGSTSGQLVAIDLVAGAEISRIQTQASILGIAPDDEQYVSRAYTQGAPTTLMNLRTQQLLRVLPWTASPASNVPTSVAFSADGQSVAAIASGDANGQGSGRAGRIRVYRLQ